MFCCEPCPHPCLPAILPHKCLASPDDLGGAVRAAKSLHERFECWV